MRKIICIILTFVLLLSLCACSSEGSNSDPSKVPTENVVENNKAETEKPEQAEQPSVETIENQVLLDENGVKVTALSLDKSSFLGPELKVQIENNTEKSLTFQVRNVSVNGYMVDTVFSSEVASGKKANDSIAFTSSSLQMCGIETLADMEFSFHIFDESWETYLDTDTVQLKTSAADSYAYAFDDSGDELYNGNGVRIVSKGIPGEDSYMGPSLIVYIENNSGKDITVQVRDTSVNGFMVDTIFSSEVCDSKHAVDDITIMSSSIEENGIEGIEEIEFYFHIFSTDDWETIVDTDPIVVKTK